MEKRKRGKLLILLVSFAVFAAGVWALSTPPGEGRRWVVWTSIGALTAIAAGVSVGGKWKSER